MSEYVIEIEQTEDGKGQRITVTIDVCSNKEGYELLQNIEQSIEQMYEG